MRCMIIVSNNMYHYQVALLLFMFNIIMKKLLTLFRIDFNAKERSYVYGSNSCTKHLIKMQCIYRIFFINVMLVSIYAIIWNE